MVNRDNYEIWLVDYLDGHLSEDQLVLLQSFLDQNSDLKVELEGLDKIKLHPEIVPFAAKESLFKITSNDLGMDYDEYSRIIEVERYVNHPSQKLTDNDFLKTLLKPDLSLSFPRKSRLKRSIVLPFLDLQLIRRVVVAASIFLILFIGSYTFFTISVPENVIVEKHIEEEKPEIVNTDYPFIAELKDELKMGSSEINNPKSILTTTKKLTKQVNSLRAREVLSPMMPKSISLPENVPFTPPDKNSIELAHLYCIKGLLNQNQKTLLALVRRKRNIQRNINILESGAKFVGFFTGNRPEVVKLYDDQGQLVAYELKTKGIMISQKLKNSL